jgi:hypothetical protein
LLQGKKQENPGILKSSRPVLPYFLRLSDRIGVPKKTGSLLQMQAWDTEIPAQGSQKTCRSFGKKRKTGYSRASWGEKPGMVQSIRVVEHRQKRR